MPRQDGTGPEGQGSKTGRGLGPCNPQSNQNTSNQPGQGKGQGKGQGRKQGRRQGNNK